MMKTNKQTNEAPFQVYKSSSSKRYRVSATVRLWMNSLLTGNIILLLLHQIVESTTIDTVSNRNLYHNEKWYTKYDAYPEYCSTPEQMSKRHIPPIDPTQHRGMIGETRLLHVTAIVRHGARTPYQSHINCWDDSMYIPEEKHWDCNLTTFLSPPPPGRIHQEEGKNSTTTKTTSNSDSAMFLFEKKYDSLQPPLGNELNGTCQKAQLLLQGYEQEYTNGQILRNAYIYSSKSEDKTKDTRLRLFDSASNGVDGKYLWDTIYYRVDDDQRTLMSGQVVIRALFEPELQTYVKNENGEYPIIPLHTADRVMDIDGPNADTCPRLSEINDNIKKSDPEYNRIFVTSKEAKLLSDFSRTVLKVPNPAAKMDAIDCLMTTICTDRTLPDPVNDYIGDVSTTTPEDKTGNDKNNTHFRYLDDNNTTDIIVPNGNNQSDNGWSGDKTNNTYDEIYGPNRFQRLINYDTSLSGYFMSFNDGESAKLGMGPLWEEILENILPFVSDKPEYADTLKHPFVLIAGHDSTLLPLLVSLGPNVWDNIWPYYASMMVLEVHSINMDDLSNRTIFQSNYAFRLLYNGKVITPRIDGCILELCDITVLLNIVQSFMKFFITNCTRQQPPLSIVEDIIGQSKALISTKDGVVLVVALCLLGMICGSFCTFLYMKNKFSRGYQHHYQRGGPITSSQYDPDDLILPISTAGSTTSSHTHGKSYIDYNLPSRTSIIT